MLNLMSEVKMRLSQCLIFSFFAAAAVSRAAEIAVTTAINHTDSSNQTGIAFPDILNIEGMVSNGEFSQMGPRDLWVEKICVQDGNVGNPTMKGDSLFVTQNGNVAAQPRYDYKLVDLKVGGRLRIIKDIVKDEEGRTCKQIATYQKITKTRGCYG